MALASPKPTSKGVTALIIIAVAIFFGVMLIYLAAAGKMRSLASELSTKEKEVQDSKKIALTLQQSKLEYLDSRAQIRCLESSVSTQAYVPTMLKQLEYLGRSINLKVLGVRPQPIVEAQPAQSSSSGSQAASGSTGSAESGTPKAEAKPYDELQVEIELEGSYMNALDFLYRLTSFPKIVSVNSMQIIPSGPTEALRSPKLNIKMNVTAFVFKANKAAQPAAQGQASSAEERRAGNEAG